MPSGITVEKITRGLLVAQKIRQLYGSDAREESGASIRPDRVALLREALQTITEFVPATRGGRFSYAIDRSGRCSAAYREMKGHLRGSRGKKTDMKHVVKTLKVVTPVLDNRQKVYFDKLIKIFEILYS